MDVDDAYPNPQHPDGTDASNFTLPNANPNPQPYHGTMLSDSVIKTVKAFKKLKGPANE